MKWLDAKNLIPEILCPGISTDTFIIELFSISPKDGQKLADYFNNYVEILKETNIKESNCDNVHSNSA